MLFRLHFLSLFHYVTVSPLPGVSFAHVRSTSSWSFRQVHISPFILVPYYSLDRHSCYLYPVDPGVRR